MNAARRTIDLSNLYLLLFVAIATVAAYLLKQNGYASLLTVSSTIILIVGGIALVAAASLYGFLENKFGKEDVQQPDSKAFSYYKKINKVFLVSQAICIIGVFAILCMLNPYYPIALLIPYIIFFIVQKLKKNRSK